MTFTTTVAAPRARRPARRVAVARAVAALVALALLYFPGLGIVDLVAAFAGLPDGELVVMRLGYGLLVALLLPAALLGIARRPRHSLGALLHLLVASLALLVTAVGSGVVTGAVGGTVLLGCVATLRALGVGREPAGRHRPPLRRPLIALAMLGIGPSAAYALAMAVEQRRGTPPYEDFTLGTQGWSSLSAFALTVGLTAALCAGQPRGWRLPACTTGLATSVFGIVAVLAPEAPGSPGAVWGSLAAVWGVVFTAAALSDGRAVPSAKPGTLSRRRNRALGSHATQGSGLTGTRHP